MMRVPPAFGVKLKLSLPVSMIWDCVASKPAHGRRHQAPTCRLVLTFPVGS